MGIVLEPPCPRSVDGISIDPEPNWNFASLLSEIESVEKKLNVFSKFPQPLTHTALRMGRRGGGFVMRVSEDEMESDVDEESEEEEEEEHRQLCTKGTRFACDDLYWSDESDDEFDSEPESFLLSKMGLAESALYEVINDHQTEVKEDIRSQVSVVETEILQEIETSRSAIARVEKYKETRKEVERKLDLQYQRKVAEALDTHLTAIQREHEIKSQIEERKIRSEEAQEEARRRERAHQEEKIRQEKARAEAEMQAKLRAEEAKKEAERKAAKEAAEKEATDRKAAEQRIAEEKAERERSSAASNAQAGGKSIQAAESALTLENHRLKKLEELEATNQSLRSRPNEDFSSFEKQITRAIKQIRGTKDNVSKKSNEIVKIFRDPRCPVSISIATFAKKIVSAKDHFAGSYVIVYVTSQFPQAMDIVLAEFHKACNYTVPKHILNSQSAWDSDAYEQLDSTMRLYGALVQNDIRGVTNIHGIDQGWAWLARFLNKTSATRATATALNAFLQMAGFGLHQRYRSQFLKVVNIVREHFLPRLRARKDASNLQTIITDITAYLDDQMYLKEPVGRTMQTNTLSAEITAEEVHQSNNQRYQGNNYYRDYY
ncbi:mRNA export factor GLE1-like [Brassica napus]|uniref:mRNA export factor GLE1-like n=1 Tax=Brassica napus TaxID=3708 RepID=UPI00207886AA|nr:mRNA export factor GLE1-like [Brassica napus]